MSEETIQIVDTTLDDAARYGLCGYKNLKKEGLPEKIDWLKKRYKEGLRIKTLLSDDNGVQGMIEYVPGEYCWRPVSATGYMFIHCIFVGFKKQYKGKGFASMLLEQCENDAAEQGMNGVAVVTRKGSFMAGKELFEKRKFVTVGRAGSDFELLVKQFDRGSDLPSFMPHLENGLKKFKKGLTILRAFQCPYTVKNVREMAEFALNEYGLEIKVVEIKTPAQAQKSPCPFGTFCVIHNGEIVAEHPISKGRFANILKKRLG